VILTDEQAHHDGAGSVDESVPTAVPMYTFGGLTDACLRMLPLLERGRDADWPWIG
jgi:hypothetical protein